MENQVYSFTEFVQDPTEQSCMYFGSWIAAYGIRDALAVVHGPPGCRSHACITFMHLDKFGDRTRFVTSSVAQDEMIFGGGQVLLKTIKEAAETYHPKLIAVITTCASEIINDNVPAIIEEAKQAGVNSHILYFPSPGYKSDDFDGFDNCLKVLAEDLVSPNGAEKKGPTVNYIGYRFNTYEYNHQGEVAEIRRLLHGLGLSVHSIWTEGKSHDEIETSSIADLNITTPLVGKSAGEVLKARFGIPYLELLPPYGLEGTEKFLRRVADEMGLTNQASPFIERELSEAVNRIRTLTQDLLGRKVAIFANPLDAIGYTNLTVELGLEPVIIGITRPLDSFSGDYLRSLFENLEGPKFQPFIGPHLHQNILELLNKNEVELVLGSSHETYMADALGIPAVNISWPIFNETMLTERFYLGFKGAVLLAETIGNLLIRGRTRNIWKGGGK